MARAEIDEVVVPVRVDVTVNLLEETTNFDDVGDFHRQFDLQAMPANGEESAGRPNLLDDDLYEFRHKFLQEELDEFMDAHRRADLADAADALIDLVYVAMGTAHFMGLPWQELWDEVQRANMAKVRSASAEESAASSGRHHSFDVIKPPGWTPPNIEGVLARWR